MVVTFARAPGGEEVAARRRATGWKAVHRNEDVVAKPRAPTVRTLVEMYVGRRAAHMEYFREHMSPGNFAKLQEWEQEFIARCIPGYVK